MDNSLELWSKALSKLKIDYKLDDDNFNELFSEAEFYKEENNYIYIMIPLALHKMRIEKIYTDPLNSCLKELSSDLKKFKFITKEEKEEDEKKKEENPFITPSTTTMTRNLSPIYTFKNFEVGESNRFAFLSAMKVAETPEKLYNPLYIFGDVGVGKTHLMTAIGHYILDNDINTNVVFVTSQKFAEEYFLATKSSKNPNSIENFYAKYHNADVLLVDDIQFLENKQSTQEEFFKLFEHLVSQNKQIVITSDKPANELKNMMDRLKSRFNWGLCVDIKTPDKNLRINILKNKLKSLVKDPNDVSMEILEILAEYFPNNVRDLEGALRSYVTYCICMNEPFTKENIYVALERMLPKDINDISTQKSNDIVEKILDGVCSYYQIAKKDLVSSSRKQQIAYARQIAMYIMRKNYNFPLKSIGENFGNKDHATVAHAVDKIENMLKNNNLAKNDIDFIVKSIEKK